MPKSTKPRNHVLLSLHAGTIVFFRPDGARITLQPVEAAALRFALMIAVARLNIIGGCRHSEPWAGKIPVSGPIVDINNDEVYRRNGAIYVQHDGAYPKHSAVKLHFHNNTTLALSTLEADKLGDRLIYALMTLESNPNSTSDYAISVAGAVYNTPEKERRFDWPTRR